MIMISTGHTAVGVAIGLAVYRFTGGSDIVAGLSFVTAAGLVSHYVTDLIPHGHFFNDAQYKSKIIYAIIFDLGLSVFLALMLVYLKNGFNLQFWYIFFAVAASQAPDVLDGFVYIGWLPKKGLIKREFRLHNFMHWHGIEANILMFKFWDIWQVFLFIFSLYLLYKY